MSNPRRLQSRGFTLIELIVVIGVVGALAVVALSAVNPQRQLTKSRDTKRKSDLAQVQRALVMYRNDYNNLYPANDVNDQIVACSPAQTKAWGSAFTCDTMVYMKVLPQDPSGGSASYKYRQVSGGTDFCLWANLENSYDPDISKYNARCTPAGSGCNSIDLTGGIAVCGE